MSGDGGSFYEHVETRERDCNGSFILLRGGDVGAELDCPDARRERGWWCLRCLQARRRPDASSLAGLPTGDRRIRRCPEHHRSLRGQIQTCIVHLIRNSLDFCSWKDRKPVAKELKTVYRAADAQAAHSALQAFEDGPWSARFAAITALWRRHWAHVIPFFAYPQEVRKMIYTTNAIESLNAKLRRSVRSRGHFPSDEAAMKLIWLQLREITQRWKMPPREWAAAKAQFAVVFGDRFEVNR